jgi:hypothetical protein
MLGPCPKCRRHVFVASSACPFCGAMWKALLSAAAAASMLLGAPAEAPAADRGAAVQEPAYGPPRPLPEAAADGAVVWNRLYAGWIAEVGLSGDGKSWSERKTGATVSYKITQEQFAQKTKTNTVAYRLAKVTDDAVTLVVTAPPAVAANRTLPTRDGVPREAKVTDEGKETLDIDGKKHDCEVKGYELPGREFKVWTCKDLGVVKIACGDWTTRLAKLSEDVAAAGKSWSCRVWETKSGETETKEWRSDKVPGGTVKWVETVKSGGKALATTTIEVTTVTEGK